MTAINQPDRRTRPDLSHAVVTGLQWGDEGKGKIVDWLTEDFDIVVRYNGGANAGHSVVIGDTRYALHLVPCGILRPDTTNIIANGVALDLEKLIEEVESLGEQGVDVAGRLKISDRAHIVFPHHKRQDALLEAAVAASAGDSKRIDTTGRGIGPCYSDKASRTLGIRVGELLDAELLRERLTHVVAVKNATLAALAEMAGPHQVFDPIDADALIERYIDIGKRIAPYVTDTARMIHRAMAQGKKVLFEGGNGSLLDIDHGSYPYVTSSSTTALGIHSGAGVPARATGRVVGIVKAYTTRVGAGPCPAEQDNEVGEYLRVRGREFGTTTGRPRRCGWLDLVLLHHTTAISGVTEMSIMLLDVLAGLDELKVCTAYELDGERIDWVPANAKDLERVTPIYEVFSGFAEEITECREFSQLPQNAQRYVEMIEERVGVRVSMVSVGPGREQTLLR